MTWGHQRAYLESLRDNVGIMPKALLNVPEPHELGVELDEAFNILSSSRQWSMGDPLPIAVSEMLLWCAGFDIADLDERLSFIRTMQKLDSAYLKVLADRKSKTDSGTNPAVAPIPVSTDNSATQHQAVSSGRPNASARS